jgi:hypothetical protein
MQLNQIAEGAVGHMFGRLLLRAFFMLAAIVFAITAIAYLTAAGSIALEMQYGLLHARLAVAAIYAAAAIITFAVLWGTRAKPVPGALTSKREMQLTMLVEAVALGYSLARKRDPIH